MSQTETPREQNRRQIVRPYAELGASLIPGDSPDTSDISDDEMEYLSRMGRSYTRYSQHDSLEEMVIAHVDSHDDGIAIHELIHRCTDTPVVTRDDVLNAIADVVSSRSDVYERDGELIRDIDGDRQ